jgi:XTP/dITP diphosphohydrolase
VAPLVIASGNPGKVREYRALLDGLGLEVEPFETGVAEVGETYEANAALKAEAASRATGLPALGDDTGLEIEALDGFPGLYSDRLAPTQAERERLVFERLAGVPRPWRARFVCVIALAVPAAPTRFFRGERAGEVVEPGAPGGFGYDRVFLVPEAGQTFSEMGLEGKNRWSHRAAAVGELLASGALARPTSGR